jgi:hypothetical protein
MQSIYTAGGSSYSMSNLYKPAGVVNINASYNDYNGTYVDNNGNTNYSNGQMISKPSVTNTSALLGVASTISMGFDQLTNTSLNAQHLDRQNPNNFSGFCPITVEFIPPIPPIVYDSISPNLVIINTPSTTILPNTNVPVTLRFTLQKNDINTYSYFTVIATDRNDLATTTQTTSSPFTFSLLSGQTYTIRMTATDINGGVSPYSNPIIITI